VASENKHRSIYGAKHCVDVLNRLGVTHSCVRQMDRLFRSKCRA